MVVSGKSYIEESTRDFGNLKLARNAAAKYYQA